MTAPDPAARRPATTTAALGRHAQDASPRGLRGAPPACSAICSASARPDEDAPCRRRLAIRSPQVAESSARPAWIASRRCFAGAGKPAPELAHALVHNLGEATLLGISPAVEAPRTTASTRPKAFRRRRSRRRAEPPGAPAAAPPRPSLGVPTPPLDDLKHASKLGAGCFQRLHGVQERCWLGVGDDGAYLVALDRQRRLKGDLDGNWRGPIERCRPPYGPGHRREQGRCIGRDRSGRPPRHASAFLRFRSPIPPDHSINREGVYGGSTKSAAASLHGRGRRS